MNEQQVRQIIRDELARFVFIDEYVFDRDVRFIDGQKIKAGKTGGLQIGTEATQKLGFFGTTPVDKPESVNNAETAPATYDQTKQQSIVLSVNSVIDRLEELGLIKTN